MPGAWMTPGFQSRLEAVMRTMKAVQIDRFGGPEVLQLREVSVPEPGAREILLKVHAAGVNPVDHKIRSGKYPAV